ncbi:MAG: hypothetical protein AAF674_04225 [Pseudomonadota bacterium]
MTKKTSHSKDPTEIAERALDDISGGPHFKTWHGEIYAYQAMPELDANVAAQATGEAQRKDRRKT